MRWRLPSLLLVVAVVLAGPAAGDTAASERISLEDLLVAEPLGAPDEPPGLVDSQEVLRVGDEMRGFLEANVDRRSTPLLRLHQLTSAIISRGTFGLRFDASSRTAAETFRLRTGNCLSFSNMFVALAREAGLAASFQEVDIPPDWSLQNDVFVLNRHVNVRIDLGSMGRRVIDFNVDDFRASYDTRTISDERALAHYFNNVGVASMQEGDVSSALWYFRRAIAVSDRRFSPAWTNLGTLYLRDGDLAHAEAAYRQALRVDREDLVALSNLAGLYDLQGRPELAAEHRHRVEEHRNRNPYFRYQRARDAVASGDWDEAIGHLKYAIRRKRSEPRFCELLARCYAEKGDDRRARRWHDRAVRLTSGVVDRRGSPTGSATVGPLRLN